MWGRGAAVRGRGATGGGERPGERARLPSRSRRRRSVARESKVFADGGADQTCFIGRSCMPIESASSKVMKQRNVRCYREDAPGSRWHTASRRGTIAMATLASRAARPISSGRTRPPSSASTSRLVAPGPAFRARAGPRVSASAALADTSSPASSSASDVELAKRALLRAVDGTCRGCVASPPSSPRRRARRRRSRTSRPGATSTSRNSAASGEWCTPQPATSSPCSGSEETRAPWRWATSTSPSTRAGTFRTKSGSAFLSCSCPRRRCATRDGTRAFRTRAAVSAVSRRLHFDPDPTHP